MLTELALTPHTFQPCPLQANEWAGQLRALNQRLVHYGSQCPLIFANLNVNSPQRTAAWRAEIMRQIGALRGPHVGIVRDLFQLIEQYLVSRPAFGHVRVVTDEQHWVREAISPAPSFPIQQIVVSYSGHAASRKVFTQTICINRLSQEPFWDGIASSAFPPMSISHQVDVLRPLWLHGQVLAVVLPYALSTGVTGEANWFFEFASRAFNRPKGHGEPAIELHASFDGNGADLKAQGVAHPVVANFVREAQRQAGLRGHEFSLVVRARSHGSQRFIVRRLFTGETANVGTGIPDVRVRWGIALEHVALRTDTQNQTPATFTLLPRQQADDQFRFECQNPSPRLLGPVTVNC
jgi:hypothetical protein